ncbi:hypothetical protein [Streptomyces sp. URMC 123]|uniref:hypothetical protein n=1 Tax=Streptomyces sp. URMC 123 TaxID=3423403 RepID=UPI003F1B90BC
MFQTFKDLKISERADEILKAMSKADATCKSREYTAASGVVTMTAHGLGQVICVTLADSMGECEGEVMMELQERIGCLLEDAEIIFHEQFNRPHPRMKGSTCFIQFEIFEGYV